LSSPVDATPPSERILDQTEDDKTRIHFRFEDETLWLTQAQTAELFQATPQNMTQHIKALYEEGELVEDRTCKQFLQVRSEDARQVRRQHPHFSSPTILSVGF
jgi:hypothetical protein